jgi:hypothetical protein
VSGLLTVHVRVNDAVTGRPTPARLRVAGPDGTGYPPFGRAADFPLGRNEAVGVGVVVGNKRWWSIDGSCEMRLPAGVPLDVEITKGTEYEPLRKSVTLGPGQMALRFALERRHPESAWMSADTRCHFLTPHDALLEAAAEGLDLVHLLATEADVPANDGHLYRVAANLSAFSGQGPALAAHGSAVAVGTYNTHPALGRLALLSSHRLVFPLSFGEESDDWSLCDWCDQCHRKGGLAVWCEAFRAKAGLPGGEALVALVLGKVDALALDAGAQTRAFLPGWYRLLNAGLRVPLVGASGKDGNRTALGAMRTYTLMEGADRDLAGWVKQTRAGRTFITNGPRLEFTVNGRPPGATVLAEGGRVEVAASADGPVEVIANGEVVAEAGGAIALPDGGWVAARTRPGDKAAAYPDRPAFAHSSPVYVEAPGRRAPRNVQPVFAMIAETRDWVETHGRFASAKSKAHLPELCAKALKTLEGAAQ